MWSFYTTDQNVTSAVSRLQYDATKVFNWFSESGLCINTDKTKIVLFNHENSTVPTNIDIKMGNTSLEVCDKYEYLGVILDSHFTLEKTIGKTVSTACNRCYMLCKMRRKM